MSLAKALVIGGVLVVGVTAYGVSRWWVRREEKQRERSRVKQYGGLNGGSYEV